jgi:predicted nucleic acid-binding protein
MAWVVDTCLVVDLLENDPVFGLPSARLMESLLAEGLLLCPVSYIELAPAFRGERGLQDEFLRKAGIRFDADWQPEDTLAAHAAWHRQVQRRRSGAVGKRPAADILIGAFALRHRGLLTRNPADFKAAFPELRMRAP